MSRVPLAWLSVALIALSGASVSAEQHFPKNKVQLPVSGLGAADESSSLLPCRCYPDGNVCLPALSGLARNQENLFECPKNEVCDGDYKLHYFPGSHGRCRKPCFHIAATNLVMQNCPEGEFCILESIEDDNGQVLDKVGLCDVSAPIVGDQDGVDRSTKIELSE